MDPVAAIVAALAAGAAEAMKDHASEAVKDAYQALKKQIQTRFSNVSVERLEQMPSSLAQHSVLQEELEAARAGDDPALERLAEKLLSLMSAKWPHPVAVSGATEIGNIRVGDVIGGSRIVTGDSNTIVIRAYQAGDEVSLEEIPKVTPSSAPVEPPSPPVLSSEQALGRIADAVRLNLGQLQLNMEQARRESSQFFRTTMIFSGLAFAIILGGIALMLGSLVTAGIVTTAASIIPQAGALLF